MPLYLRYINIFVYCYTAFCFIFGKNLLRLATPLTPFGAGKFAPILQVSQAIISAVGKKKKKLNCQCQKQASLLPSQLLPFTSIVLTVLKNDATKGKT